MVERSTTIRPESRRLRYAFVGVASAALGAMLLGACGSHAVDAKPCGMYKVNTKKLLTRSELPSTYSIAKTGVVVSYQNTNNDVGDDSLPGHVTESKAGVFTVDVPGLPNNKDLGDATHKGLPVAAIVDLDADGEHATFGVTTGCINDYQNGGIITLLTR